MPIYKPARHGVSLAEALHEAAAVAPLARAMLDAFECFHPLGTPDGPIYVVADLADLIATKEAGATRDAGLQVEFMRASVQVGRPEESDQAASPELTLTFGAVGGELAAALRRARGSLEPWQLIHRVYASDDTSGPAIMPPLQLYLTGADITAEAVTLTASFGDSANVSVPRLTFNREEYPGLVP